MNEIPASDIEFGIFLGVLVISVIITIHAEAISQRLFKRTKSKKKDTDILRANNG